MQVEGSIFLARRSVANQDLGGYEIVRVDRYFRTGPDLCRKNWHEMFANSGREQSEEPPQNEPMNGEGSFAQVRAGSAQQCQAWNSRTNLRLFFSSSN